MKSFGPYLNFDGNAREAMTFYHKCLGGDLSVQTFGEVKAPGPPGSENRVVHARIVNGSATLMASDWGARFGMLIDKFGVHWMFNYNLPQTT